MTISDDDREAFAAAMRDVRRLKPDNRASLDAPRPKPKADFSRAAREALLEESLQGPDAGEAGPEIAYRRDTVGLKTFRRLRRGDFALEAEIDLHGLGLAAAEAELKTFLNECIARGLVCVRVVHGKGTRSGPAGPILKPSVQHWLARWDQVQAFVSAQARHGGSGAVYVLLRRR